MSRDRFTPTDPKDEKADRKARLVLALVLGVPLGVFFLGAFVWPEVAPVSFVRTFDTQGRFDDAEAAPNGLALLETVKRSSTKGLSFRVSRFRVVDPMTGAPVTGPWVIPSVNWLGVSGELAFAVDDELGLQGWSLRTGLPAMTMEQVASSSPQLGSHLSAKSAKFELRDGKLLFSNDQAEHFSLDPVSGQLTSLADRSAPYVKTPRDGAPEWQGNERRTLPGGQGTYLLASWLKAAGSKTAIPAGTAWVASHWEKMGEAGHGSGLLISAIDVSGAELWRYSFGGDRAPSQVRVLDPVMVLVLEREEGRGVRGVDLYTGKERFWLK